jgi:hypothetical protein
VAAPTVLNTVSWELFGRSVGKDNISLEFGVGDLADDLLVGDSDDQSVFRAGVLDNH